MDIIEILGVNVTGVLAGIITFFIFIFCYDGYSRAKKRKIKESRSARSREQLFLPVASIATDLQPLVKDLNFKNGKIQIVGGDGEYIDKKKSGPFFENAIRTWITDSYSVDYLLINPTQKVRKKFESISEKVGEKFQVFALNEECNSSTKELASKLVNFHPTLISEPETGKKAMWVETDHPNNSIHAYNVYFTSNEAMTDERASEFDKYKGYIDSVKDNCAPLCQH